MKLPLQITYRNVPATPSIEADIRSRAEKLDQYFDRITSCRVVVEAPHHSHHKGNHFRVRVDITVPGSEFVAGRDPRDAGSHEDLYVAIRDAFRAAERELKSHNGRRRDKRRDAVA